VVTTVNIADGSVTAIDLAAPTFSTTFWKVDGNAGTTPGLHFVGTTDNQPLELKVNHLRALRLEPNGSDAPHVIGGSISSSVDAGRVGAFIGGGRQHTVQGDWTSIGGGERNYVAGQWSTVGGGHRNDAATDNSTVGGGHNNRSTGIAATIGGGDGNISTNPYGTVGGGEQNVSGGQYASVPGGRFNAAVGDYSFAAGRRAKAHHNGAFVWGDSIDADFDSTAENQFSIRASGGVRLSSDTPNLSFDGANTSIVFPPTGGANAPMIHMFASGTGNSPRMVLAHSPDYPDYGLQYDDAPDKFHFLSGGFQVMTVDLGTGRVGIGTPSPTAALDVNGEVKATFFTTTSDRAAKENFRPVDAQQVLAKVAAMPIARWNFKALPGAEHIGPMAQDFHAAFGIGVDDKHIATVDADGVALAAIQGLNQKVEEQRAQLGQKETEIAELKQRLERLERFLIKNDAP
jgi:hypothetical protein